MNDIRYYDTFTKIDPIHKGWSGDKKFYIETKNSERLLLRISDISKYEEKKYEFALIKKISAVGINMSQPIDFGVCCDEKNVYQILTWVEGKEAKEVLPSLPKEEQYAFGWEAGQMLLKMQTAESHPPSSAWMNIYEKRLSEYIKTYKTCGQKLVDENLLFSFLEQHASCLAHRPMYLLHADFQSDNMVISPDNKLYAIDFQGSGMIDPYCALTGVMVTAEVSPQFSIGQLHSYFGRQIPEDFWKLNAFYMIAESINAFSVAATLGQEEVDYSNKMIKVMLEWFNNFNNIIPSWYKDY